MKEMLFIAVIVIVYVFGYYIVTKTDRFVKDSHRIANVIQQRGRGRVKIGTESYLQPGCIYSAVKRCTDSNPNIGLIFRKGKAEKLLKKLTEGKLDMVILTESYNLQQDNRYSVMKINCRDKELKAYDFLTADNNSVKELFVVWNRNTLSKKRDSVIFALENELYTLKSGYADYRD